MAGAAVGLGAVALGAAPWLGGVIVGVALLAGAVFRLTVPDERAGLLGVRSRRTDVLALAALGALLVIGSLSFLLRLHTT